MRVFPQVGWMIASWIQVLPDHLADWEDICTAMDESLKVLMPCCMHGAQVRLLVSMPVMDMPAVSTGELQKWLAETVTDHMPEDLREPFLRALKESPIRSLETKGMPPVPKHRPGSILIGDALNMRHPATGTSRLHCLPGTFPRV